MLVVGDEDVGRSGHLGARATARS